MSHRKSVSTGNNIGIRYENYINQILKKKSCQPMNLSSAGATDRPDGYFSHNGMYPFEIKRDLGADFAQIELNWDTEKRFFYSNKSKNFKFVPVLESKKFLDEVNSKWTSTPRRFTKINVDALDRNWDQDHFQDIQREIDAKLVEDFYNLKEPPVNYIQIGGRGFFYMNADVAKLNVPRLKGTGILRARVKTRDSKENKYGFLVAIKLRTVIRSTYDIEEKNGRTFPF
jgi:hypothetical protein